MNALPIRATLANIILERLLQDGWKLRMDAWNFSFGIRYMEIERLQELAELARTADLNTFLDALKKEGLE